MRPRYVAEEKRVVCEQLGDDFWLALDLAQTTFFVWETTIVPAAAASGMALWRKRLFAVMTRVAGDTVAYFNLPADRVVELGIRVEI